jgi:hypothetical protein
MKKDVHGRAWADARPVHRHERHGSLLTSLSAMELRTGAAAGQPGVPAVAEESDAEEESPRPVSDFNS